MHGFRFQLRTVAARLTTRIRLAFLGEVGAASIEYSFLVALITTVIITIIGQVGLQLLPGFQTVVNGF